MPILKDWFRHFITNKDLVFRKIASIDEGKKGFDLIIKNKDGTKRYILMCPKLTKEDIDKGSTKKDYGLVCYNTKANVECVIEHWKTLISVPGSCVYFVNPYSEGDQKWIIMPYTHDKVSEMSALKLGLMSMFQSVEAVPNSKI
jgi:hypothetical protein